MAPSTSAIFRLARASDVREIADIYNHEIEHSTATFDTELVSLDERRRWLAAHASDAHPVVVAEVNSAVAGWASLSPWSERCAYSRAAEVSVYVHREFRGRGLGRSLLQQLIARARTAGLGVLLARIVSESDGSVALHASLGFEQVGTMRRVGEKFGRILDVELMDLQLDS